MANIVAIFYSQRSRSKVTNRYYLWDNKGSIYSLFKKVLFDRYLTVGHLRQSDEYKDFPEEMFIDMLRILHQMNRKHFAFNPDKHYIGFGPEHYLGKLYTLLGIEYKMFDINKVTTNFSYSPFNKEYDDKFWVNITDGGAVILHNSIQLISEYEDNRVIPDILIIRITTNNVVELNKNIIDDMEIRPELESMNDEISYNGSMYNLDSVILGNFNNTDDDHVIVGMTCKKKKYIYNGIPYMGKRGYPCHLIKHNWNIRSDKDFYLSDNDCVIHARPKYFGGFNERCYNFSKGMRILIYVRKNAFGTSSSKEMDISNYQNLLIQQKAFEKKREEEEYAKRLAFEIASVLKQTEERRLSAERKEAEARRLSAERKEEARRLSAERKEAEARRLSAERKEVAKRLSAERKEVAKRLSAERKEVAKRKRINYEIDDLANIIQGLKLSPQKKQEKGNVEIIPKPKAKAKANLKAKAKTMAKVNPKAKAKVNLKNKIERIIKKQRFKSRSSSL